MSYDLDDLPESNIDLDSDTMLAAVSPVLLHDLSLSTTCRAHSPSVSCSSTTTNSFSQDFDFDVEMAFQGDEEAARRLMCSSSADASYYSQTSSMPTQHVLYTSQHPSLTNQSWLSASPDYVQQPSSYHHSALPPNGLYSPFDNPLFVSGGGVIPPTPQATEGAAFFNSAPPQPQPGYLATTSPHATSYSSHESNATSLTSSLSRSCSPVSLNCTASATSYSRSSPAPTYNNNFITAPQSSQTAIPLSSSTHHSQPRPQQSTSNSLHAYGIPVPTTSPSQPQTWRCAYPNCSSRALFTRGCDLRKHFNRHSKNLFCRVKGCPQSGPKFLDPSISSPPPPTGFNPGGASGIGGSGAGAVANAAAAAAGYGPVAVSGGFSSKKDRARHEAKHNPRILCEWVGDGGERCGRRFSRVDNMKDHVRRIHRKGQQQQVLQLQQQQPQGQQGQQLQVATTHFAGSASAAEAVEEGGDRRRQHHLQQLHLQQQQQRHQHQQDGQSQRTMGLGSYE